MSDSLSMSNVFKCWSVCLSVWLAGSVCVCVCVSLSLSGRFYKTYKIATPWRRKWTMTMAMYNNSRLQDKTVSSRGTMKSEIV